MHGSTPWLALLATLLLAALAGCGARPEPADLVLLNGTIVTLDPQIGEATALAARDGRIVAVGSDAEVRALVGDGTRTVDLAGGFAVPGFIEGHGHFNGLGRALMNVRLQDARSWEEIVERAADAARDAAPGEWITGRGWHQDKWDRPPDPQVEGYPTHDLLSRAVPDHPVVFRHASGHAVIANSAALRLAGIDASTPDPPGGEILRDARGRPTGVLRENAADPVEEALDAARAERFEALTLREIELADRECLSNGVTSFQDAGASFATVDLMRRTAEAGKLGVRLWVMLSEDNPELEQQLARYRAIGAADSHLTVRAIKRQLDGALGTHSAWLLEPYVDLPQSTGLETLPLDELEATARLALAQDMQLCVHAIGDRANRETLDLYQRLFEEAGGGAARRWRIEHAQHLDPQDIPRFAELGVVASMQAVHCTSDGSWVAERLGDRRCADGAYMWRSLIDSGAVVSNGTDTPVEDVDPIANYYAAVTRRLADGRAFYPEQRMTRTEALRSMTVAAAYAAFEEHEKGTLTPGKLADVVVLSQNLLTVPDDRILDTEVVYTIVGGNLLYEGERP